MIRVNALSITSRDGEVLLPPTTFSVAPGERVHLAGATGSGKTLLLHALAALDRPDLHYHGRRTVAGVDAAASRPAELAAHVGVLFQDTSDRLVHPTVAGTLAVRLENLGVPRDEGHRRVRDALDRLELPADRETAYLSEGEARRLAVEALLVARPRVLLLDEPLAGLDRGNQRRLLARLAALEGVTILLTEHRRDLLAPFTTRSLEAGRRHREVMTPAAAR